MPLSKEDLEVAGYQRVYDYTQYSHTNHTNVIPEKDFKRLVHDTFKTITDTLRETYGPYASTVMISSQNETTTTKDGYNVFNSMYFSHAYKHKVYIAIKDIIDRVNKRVGDGTTSCILLAEKMFNALSNIATTADEKRNLINVLNMIEKDLQSGAEIESDREDGIIQPLSLTALKGLISLAGNYDKDLTQVMMDALQPKLCSELYPNAYDSDDDKIDNVRNVVVEAHIERDGDSTTNYSIDYLPGDYRIRVFFDIQEVALKFMDKTKIPIALYDHAFGVSDWNFLTRNWDKKTQILVLARDFKRDFLDNEYRKWCMNRRNANDDLGIYLCWVKGNYFKNEIKDLAAILDTEVFGLEARNVIIEDLPVATVEVHKENCMCFYTDHVPTNHINNIKTEMNSDTSDSVIKRNEYLNRIKALSLKSKDTRVTVTSGTNLELKMTSDKIDDCVSIVNSALEFGVVPNMLQYGHIRIDRILNKNKESKELYLIEKVCSGINTSIEGLFDDIWKSKHEDQFEDRRDAIKSDMYKADNQSFDVIREAFVSADTLPTSAQYDIEVIVAAISIVKYLLTSRMFIFDSHLMTNINDEGHYQQM